MIEYTPGSCSFGFIFRCKGSVFPKACTWAIPSAIIAMVLHGRLHDVPEGMIQFWSSYNFILGVLLVFRTQQAYSRFWEGATILLQVRGEWVNCVSSCFSFCTVRPEMRGKVEHFQHLLVRLMSLCYCTALQQVGVLSDEAFDIFDLDGVSEECLIYLSTAPEKGLVVVQWIQQLIVTGTRTGILEIPAPILTRAFQELSRGVVNITDALKITDIQLPFPYAQMVTVMLILFSLVTPTIAAAYCEDRVWAALLSFVVVLFFWSLNYIAAEIETPFGEDPNDLPIAYLQMGMNAALRSLLDPRCATVPNFNFHEKHRDCSVIKCPSFLITDCQHFLWQYNKEGTGKIRASAGRAGISRYSFRACTMGVQEAVQRGEQAVTKALQAPGRSRSRLSHTATCNLDNADSAKHERRQSLGLNGGCQEDLGNKRCLFDDDDNCVGVPFPRRPATDISAAIRKLQEHGFASMSDEECFDAMSPMASGQTIARRSVVTNDDFVDLRQRADSLHSMLKRHFDRLSADLENLSRNSVCSNTEAANQQASNHIKPVPGNQDQQAQTTEASCQEGTERTVQGIGLTRGDSPCSSGMWQTFHEAPAIVAPRLTSEQANMKEGVQGS